MIEVRKYWSQPLKDALGIHQDGGFPAQLSLLTENKPQPVPAVGFYDNITQSIADVLNKEIKIYVTPTDYFTRKFRQMFTNTKITFRSAKYAKKWLGGPHMSFWPQQLNFAFWCATTGCGVSREILFPSGSSLNLTPQIHSFYLFHVYYTTRKILYEIGGIQSKGALPDNPVFNQKDNPYDIASYKRICAEFSLNPSTDFRYKKGSNHGLGKVFINITRGGSVPTGMSYPSAKAKYGDEGGDPGQGNLAAFIRNDDGTDKQFEHFAPNNAKGFTNIGLARINQSIQAYCYSVLGAQANSHTSIIGDSGSAKNTQLDYLILVEDAIKTLDASNVKYQNSCKPSPTFLPTVFMPFAAALAPSARILASTPIVMPTAVTTTAMVKPYFLKRTVNRSLRVCNLILARSRRGSLSTICSLSCTACSLSCSTCFFLSRLSLIFSQPRARTSSRLFSSFATFVSSSMNFIRSSSS